MKIRFVLLLSLAIIILFNCSCEAVSDISGDYSDSESAYESEPQRMAYRLCETAYIDNTLYMLPSVSFTKLQIYAIECDNENFSVYTPCFDPVCDHWDRSKCIITTSRLKPTGTELLTAFMYNGDPSFLLYNPIDTCFAMPYSNSKTTLLCEDFIYLENSNYTEARKAYREWFASDSMSRYSEQFVYKDYYYYVELKNGVRTQYRIPLTGGEPERVFEEDNIIIRTIINDRFYGIRYENADPENPWEVLKDPDNLHYFRSDMNYENIEPLPEILDFFILQGDNKFTPKSNAILDADEEFLYVTQGMKVWAVSDSDIHAEPILISDMNGKLPDYVLTYVDPTTVYFDGIIYCVSNTERYNQAVLDEDGSPKSLQWYTSTFYSFDTKTGECKVWNISDQNYLINAIWYADDKYVYAQGIYIHSDNRSIQGVTMRLTLDTMRYEVILPDRFWEYSAETTS